MSDSGLQLRERSRIPHNSPLIVIDVQNGFDDPAWGRRNNPEAEKNIARLLKTWRNAGMPVIFVKHMSTKPNSPLRSGQEGNEIKQIVKPLRDETIIRKKSNNAFFGTDLEMYLQRLGYQSLILVGLTTDHCVSTTARMAVDLGFKPYVIADATATFDRIGYDGKRYEADLIHRTALASLSGEFATVMDTDSLLKMV
jgi:nicotinamidase-related amidase